MEGNPDFHRSGTLKSLLTEGEEVIRTARVSDHPNWLGRLPAVRLSLWHLPVVSARSYLSAGLFNFQNSVDLHGRMI
ncbi:hypothetical protein HED50_21460 [Ochrobactrum oryzae]|nr:hypothetical protein [Brucella oryzae]